jgi:hypothetical protein
VHHQRRGITAKGEQEGEGVSRSLGWGNRREIRAGCPRRRSDVSGEELPEGQWRAVWNRDAGCDHEARGAEANSVAATPGAIGRRQCGGGHATNARGRRWARDVVSRQHMHALREVCCILTSPMADLCPNLARGSPATAKLGFGRTSDCGSTFPGSRSAAEVLDGPDSVSWEKGA